MQLTSQIKLFPDEKQSALLDSTMCEYIRCVNQIVSDMVDYDQRYCFSSKMIEAELPSALKNQCAKDANSIDKKQFKFGTLAVCKKPVAVWNNQNYSVTESSISMPLWIDGKSKKISVDAMIPAEILRTLQSHRLGTLRITKRRGKYIAQIAYEVDEKPSSCDGIMGVDLGLKCPAVCCTDAGKIKFVGNGRKNKYIRRHFKQRRRKLGKAKKLNAVKKPDDKEQRIMKDIDHKISREIVNFAIRNHVGTIKLEQLANIRSTTSKSRKNGKNNGYLHTWSFYRLASFIEYKAKLAGIQVEYVNPSYTSKKCPMCGSINESDDRKYTCNCGYHNHRDIVGAINICASTEISGNRKSA